MNTQVVRPAGAGHETLWVLLAAACVLVVAAALIGARAQPLAAEALSPHQVDARTQLNAAEQGVHADLLVAADEIAALAASDGALPAVQRLRDMDLPPFAVGMGATGSVEVLFDSAEGQAIGNPGDYLQRPGFWQGGIGIAACWYGAARQIAEALRQHCAQRQEPHALAHLGAVDTALYAAANVLRFSTLHIDAHPDADAELLARRARAVVEQSAEQVMREVGRALGAGPFCKDRHFARLMADLPVFLRQSHAERDLAALGQSLAEHPEEAWTL